MRETARRNPAGLLAARGACSRQPQHLDSRSNAEVPLSGASMSRWLTCSSKSSDGPIAKIPGRSRAAAHTPGRDQQAAPIPAAIGWPCVGPLLRCRQHPAGCAGRLHLHDSIHIYGVVLLRIDDDRLLAAVLPCCSSLRSESGRASNRTAARTLRPHRCAGDSKQPQHAGLAHTELLGNLS